MESELTASLENFEKLVQEHEDASRKTLEAGTKAAIILNELAVHPEESTRQLCNHIVLNGDRYQTYEQIRSESRNVLSTKKYFDTGDAPAGLASGVRQRQGRQRLP